MNLLFTADRGYREHVRDCIQSIVRFPAEGGYDAYILHSDFTAADQAEFEDRFAEDIRFHFIRVEADHLAGFPETPRYPRVIYYRIFAAALLPENLDRILYLDGDTIVINPLDELYHMDFEGNDILACTHIRKVLNKINQLRLGMEEEHVYINSGVMLMNLKALRKHQSFGDVAEYVEKKKHLLSLPDQDVIAALYGDRIGLLDTMIYNLSDRMLAVYHSDPRHAKRDLDWVRKHTVIIHYCGKQKPWAGSYFGRLDVFYRELKEENPPGEPEAAG